MSQIRRTAADEPFLVVRSAVAEPLGRAVIEDPAHAWHQLIHISGG